MGVCLGDNRLVHQDSEDRTLGGIPQCQKWLTKHLDSHLFADYQTWDWFGVN